MGEVRSHVLRPAHREWVSLGWLLLLLLLRWHEWLIRHVVRLLGCTLVLLHWVVRGVSCVTRRHLHWHTTLSLMWHKTRIRVWVEGHRLVGVRHRHRLSHLVHLVLGRGRVLLLLLVGHGHARHLHVRWHRHTTTIRHWHLLGSSTVVVVHVVVLWGLSRVALGDILALLVVLVVVVAVVALVVVHAWLEAALVTALVVVVPGLVLLRLLLGSRHRHLGRLLRCRGKGRGLAHLRRGEGLGGRSTSRWDEAIGVRAEVWHEGGDFRVQRWGVFATKRE